MSDVRTWGGSSPIKPLLNIYFCYLNNLNLTQLDIVASMLFHQVSLAPLPLGTGSDDMLSPCSAPTGQSWSVHMKLYCRLQTHIIYSKYLLWLHLKRLILKGNIWLEFRDFLKRQFSFFIHYKRQKKLVFIVFTCFWSSILLKDFKG